MADILLLPDDLSQPWIWQGRLAEPASLAGLEAPVVMGGQSVRALAHDLPDLRARERLQAARFAAEPDLAGSLDELHIVVGENHILAVARARMDAVVEALDAAGVSPQGLFVDFSVLPPAALPDRTVLGTATVDAGFPLESLGLEDFGLDAPPPPMTFGEALAEADLAGTPDLLSGAYAPRRLPGLSDAAPLLRRAAAVVAVMGAGLVGLQAAEARAERLQVEDLRARAAQEYTQATGETSANPARDAARLAASPDTPGALDHLAVLQAALGEVDGVSLQRARFRGAQARGTGEAMELELLYPDFAAAGALEQAVARRGGTLDAGGIRESGGRLQGQAELRLD